MQIGHGHVLQRDGVVGVIGDHRIGPDLARRRHHRCEIGEEIVVDFDDVVRGRTGGEILDRVIAEAGGKDEDVAACELRLFRRQQQGISLQQENLASR